MFFAETRSAQATIGHRRNPFEGRKQTAILKVLRCTSKTLVLVRANERLESCAYPDSETYAHCARESYPNVCEADAVQPSAAQSR